MLKLNNEWLASVGLADLAVASKNEFLAHTYQTLEMRVGLVLAEQMTNDQLDAFELLISAKDEAGALEFLEINIPNYKQVVNDAFVELTEEIRSVAPQILAAG